jgi:hypothetical protein
MTATRAGYVRPVERCTVCGVNRSGRSYRTRQRICPECAQRPRASCDTCGRDAPIPEPGASACCAHCATGLSGPCVMCGELTIARDRQGRAQCEKCYRRPVGTCGRCGRVRAIVRRATGGDPDLCAICWTGPMVACENCGQVRPCRGERRGRMLCSKCAPVAAQRCARCGRDRRPTAHWPEGPVCSTCYHRALSAKGTCPSCGRTRRLLRYPGQTTAVCRECAGAADDHVCRECGAEEALQERGLCGRCVLRRRLSELLGDEQQRVRVGLDGLFDALSRARSAKDTLRWLDTSPAVSILARIASGELRCTHETLDALDPDPAVRHLQHLLVATGALPPRDPALARLELWIDEFLSAHREPELRTFAYWIVLRRCRRNSRRGPLGEGVINSAKTELKSAAALLDWLSSRDIPLAEVTQADVDAWLVGPRPDRYVARSFARFAIRRQLMPKLTFPAGRTDAVTPAVAVGDRVALARRLLHEDGIETRDRVAGLLVVLFAQPVTRIANLTVDDVAIDHEKVAVQLGETAITLPQPLADHLRQLVVDREGRAAAALPTPPWLFPGSSPGRPIGAQSLSRRLKRIGVDCHARRIAALLDMAGQIPAPVLADLLGIGILTATKWAEIAGRPWGEYPTLRTSS